MIFLWALAWIISGMIAVVVIPRIVDGKCPPRRALVVGFFGGFVLVVVGLFVLVSHIWDKMMVSDWWDKPVC